MKKLAIIITHPIQYYAPLFAILHNRRRIHIRVYYTWGQGVINKYDPGFQKMVTWDTPLLEGYPFEWAENSASQPGSHHFQGIINPSLIASISMFNPDAILVFGWAYHSHLKTLRHFKNKIPVYFRGDSTLIDKSLAIKRLFRNILLRWVYSYVDHAFYVGTANKAYLKKAGLKESQLTFAPHAVDNVRFAEKHNEQALKLRKELGLKPDDILLLFAGKFEDKKSPETLLRVFLRFKQPGIHLLLVGNGRLEQQMKQTAMDVPNVHFLDFQNQSYMPVIYQAADLFCLPSKGPGETWGLAVNEAMASGKAVLVSDKVGCSADLVLKENGAVFTAENEAELERVLQLMLGDKRKLKEMGMASAKIIAAWNFDNIAIAIEDKLLSEKGTIGK